jgi:hypothetical protein
VEKVPAAYEKALELAKSGSRRAVNVRVTPRPDVPQKDPAIRLQPKTDPPRPALARKLRNGWHALRLKDKVTRVVIFVVAQASCLRLCQQRRLDGASRSLCCFASMSVWVH